jgi:hypothetical protein
VLSPAWIAALLLAVAGIARQAKRGVSGALPPGPARELAEQAPTLDAGPWLVALTAAVAHSLGSGLRRGRTVAELLANAWGVITSSALSEHSRHVQWIAIFAGATHYVWTTRRDERVRPLHVLLEGTLQRWDDPPLAGLPAFFGHPGHAAGCRCVPFPILL